MFKSLIGTDIIFHTHHIVTPGFVDRPRRSDCTAGQMDGEAGWWTTSGNIGLPPLARVMGVGRQQQYITHIASHACGLRHEGHLVEKTLLQYSSLTPLERECYEGEVQPYRKTDYKPIIYIESIDG